jgi:hypothetical protein
MMPAAAHPITSFFVAASPGRSARQVTVGLAGGYTDDREKNSPDARARQPLMGGPRRDVTRWPTL